MAWYTPMPVADELKPHIVCGWTARIDRVHRLTPDGCVDVLWTSTGALTVCGPETTGWTIRLPESTEAVGVRLRPGVAHNLFRTDMTRLRDRRIPLADFVGDRAVTGLRARLETQSSDRARAEHLVGEVADWLHRAAADDRLVAGVASCLGRTCWDVSELAAATSLSTRQFQRRCLAAFGYGPATLRAILRLQRFMALAQRLPGCTLTELAHECGFSDQAHLNRESRRLSGLTPTALLAGEAPRWHGDGTPWWERSRFASERASLHQACRRRCGAGDSSSVNVLGT